MTQTNQTDICTRACMHTRAHIHLSKIVTAMSRFTASRLDEKERYSCLYSRPNKSGYISIQFMLLAIVLSSV